MPVVVIVLPQAANRTTLFDSLAQALRPVLVGHDRHVATPRKQYRYAGPGHPAVVPRKMVAPGHACRCLLYFAVCFIADERECRTRSGVQRCARNHLCYGRARCLALHMVVQPLDARDNLRAHYLSPQIRARADAIWNSGWRPRRIHFMMTTFREERTHCRSCHPFDLQPRSATSAARPPFGSAPPSPKTRKSLIEHFQLVGSRSRHRGTHHPPEPAGQARVAIALFLRGHVAGRSRTRRHRGLHGRRLRARQGCAAACACRCSPPIRNCMP